MSNEAHRGPLLSIRGWLEYPENSARRVREILDGFVERAADLGLTPEFVREVNKAWVLPELQVPQEERFLFWSYLFVGAELNVRSEPLLREQVEALASLWEWDGPLKRWMAGRIEVEDDGGTWARVWKVAEGVVREASE